MIKNNALGPIIRIGHQGENRAIAIAFKEAESWPDTYGSGQFSLWARRPGEETIYPCVLQYENNIPLWIVTASDTEIASSYECNGRAELRYSAGEVVVKTRVYETIIEPSLLGETTSISNPAQYWVDSIVQDVIDALPVYYGEVV